MNILSQLYSNWDVINRFDEEDKIILMVKVSNEHKDKFINLFSRYIMDIVNDKTDAKNNSDNIESNFKKSDDNMVKNIIRDTRRISDMSFIPIINYPAGKCLTKLKNLTLIP